MFRQALLAAALAALADLAGSAQQVPAPAGRLVTSIDAKKDQYAAVARQIWDYAELGS
jgi:hypothetical protein